MVVGVAAGERAVVAVADQHPGELGQDTAGVDVAFDSVGGEVTQQTLSSSAA